MTVLGFTKEDKEKPDFSAYFLCYPVLSAKCTTEALNQAKSATFRMFDCISPLNE